MLFFRHLFGDVSIIAYLCSMKIDHTIEAFINYISTERRLAAATVEVYSDTLAQFANLLERLEIEEIEQVTAREVRQFQMELMDRGMAPATVGKMLSAMSTWFKFLRRQKWVTTDVMAKITYPKLPKHLPVFYRESEVEKIYTLGEELFGNDFVGVRDQLILKVLYETGMRRAELVGLTEASFDLTGNTVKVLGKRDKERYIPIENELVHNIRHYLTLKREINACSDTFFVQPDGRPMSMQHVYAVVKRYMSQISNAEKISPHVFRHSFATHMLNEGADIDAIKELLGHANLGVTEIYTHVSREHLKEAYKHAHPRATRKEKE